MTKTSDAMRRTSAKIRERIESLSFDEREELLHFLLEFQGYEFVPEADEEWEAELDRRMEEVRSGRDKGIAGEQFLAELREKYPCTRSDSNAAPRGSTKKQLNTMKSKGRG